ncbi:MAG TPA: shikimate dehydrogenase [Pyrinomonadaceae bacterium]|nr:shikimate dehydrogenase [Pyrinomonadaceae bacterium]
MPKEESKVRVCVPVCVRHAGELRASVARAAEVADIVELRLDCLDEDQLEPALRQLAALFDETPRPFIITFRPAEQGGRRALDKRRRASFWHDFFKRLHETTPMKAHVLADIELDLFESPHGESLREVFKDEPSLICSHHDFGRTPADLETIFERMARTPARVLKVAVQAGDITDCVAVLRLLERARREGREMIAVAMGEAGFLTRVLAPSRGAFLTYGSLDAAQATAPGQLSARELCKLYRVHEINAGTLVTGVVGSPVAHSLSPHMHNAAFAALGLDAVYIPFETADASAFVRRMAHPRTRELEWRLRGLSVTAPHKTSFMRHLDCIEPKASEIGAVNTVVVEGEELHGYNTDAEAALSPLRGLVELGDARVAVIGAGGAARALLWGLRARGARTTLFARNVESAGETARAFGADASQIEGASFDGFDLVVNATPLGTRGENEKKTPATSEQLRGARIAYDLVYNPSETRFLREARSANCETVGGLSMLVAQAAEQFRLWTGRDAPVEIMRDAAEKQRLEVGG